MIFGALRKPPLPNRSPTRVGWGSRTPDAGSTAGREEGLKRVGSRTPDVYPTGGLKGCRSRAPNLPQRWSGLMRLVLRPLPLDGVGVGRGLRGRARRLGCDVTAHEVRPQAQDLTRKPRLDRCNENSEPRCDDAPARAFSATTRARPSARDLACAQWRRVVQH